MKGGGRRLHTNASDFRVRKGEAFSGTRDRLEWSGGWGRGLERWYQGQAQVRVRRERGDLTLDSIVKLGRIPR